MNQDDIERYLSRQTTSVCVDLSFDQDAQLPRATQIHVDHYQWSIVLRYLSYEQSVNLDDSHFTQAYVRGNYSSLSEIIQYLEDYLDAPFKDWINYTRHGYHIELSPQELGLYQAINWNHWIPQQLIVPSGSEFEVIRPWRGVLPLLIPCSHS